jgi:hypothetical protein
MEIEDEETLIWILKGRTLKMNPNPNPKGFIQEVPKTPKYFEEESQSLSQYVP